jgi:von Willebrand factor type A domain
LAWPFALFACGGSDSGSIFENSGSGAGGGTSSGSGGGSVIGPGSDSDSGAGGSLLSESDAAVISLPDVDNACAKSTASAQLTPVNLVIMYDKSGSMGDTTQGFDPALKWLPVGAGMKAFLSDTASRGLDASLQFFPLGDTADVACPAAYGTPRVPMTPLTDSSAFVTAIDATQPSGGTPTLPALQGAATYARQVATEQPTAKTAVVLVTDGEPGYRINGQNVTGCPDNDIAHVAALAKTNFEGSPSIATYVVGVGPSLDKLNAIASAGGTGQAIMVSVADPAQTATVFQQALESVRSATLSCDFGFPSPPDGSTLDVNQVNVLWKSGGGTDQVVGYNVDCRGGIGWRYDNPAAPAHIQLCTSSCSTAQGDRDGKITVLFGCQTVPVDLR